MPHCALTSLPGVTNLKSADEVSNNVTDFRSRTCRFLLSGILKEGEERETKRNRETENNDKRKKRRIRGRKKQAKKKKQQE
jgi:hypothetical protein